MHSSHRRSGVQRLIRSLAGLAFALASSAHAQLLTTLTLERDRYISHEPTLATVTVENRAGKDIVLGGPNGTSWFTLDVRRVEEGSQEGVPILARNGEEPSASTHILKNGATITRKVDLQAFYPMEMGGQYVLGCSVYFPDLDKWIGATKKTSVVISRPRAPFWKQTFGGPVGSTIAGQYRRYSLFTTKSNFRNGPQVQEHNLIYVHIQNEKTEDTISIFPISPILNYYDPQPTVDKDANLHVLYMANPTMYSHVLIDPDGNIKDVKQYQSTETSKPSLMQTKTGSVNVRGGIAYDAIAAAQKARLRAAEEKSLSDRPPGLPKP